MSERKSNQSRREEKLPAADGDSDRKSSSRARCISLWPRPDLLSRFAAQTLTDEARRLFDLRPEKSPRRRGRHHRLVPVLARSLVFTAVLLEARGFLDGPGSVWYDGV